MRHWLFVLCVGVLVGCSDKPSPPTGQSDAGTIVEDAGTASGVERPGALERPPLERLPDDLKPPAQ
ncbi:MULTISPECIES: hypothetical protein [unclassified Corallococcus]|uniref:hypothetical protein n=1 Tax=unclassified Corallococcus TaxID=2685029 RepID=UPI001A8FFE49|nr:MULTISPECIES: hypothetical protein [unclassified Corallococcus]MBN9683673.1 hypothetical protein [Corallococcus sp. NCSPR001]WAS84817.1 hypothetical protein O0N60_36835 [Corallococcus sp. NCRR]